MVHRHRLLTTDIPIHMLCPILVASTVVDETKSLREELMAALARHDRVESKLNVANEQKVNSTSLRYMHLHLS